MLCNTVKAPSVNPIPGRYKVDNDISQNNSESSPLTSEINFASNSAQELFIQKKTSTRLTDGFLTRVWRSLQASGDKHSRENISDEEGTELKEILTIGETLRQQANSLSASNNEAPVPQAWKGSLLKRCLVGAGLLTGTGLLGGAGYAGYKHYHARATSTENNQQPGSPYTSPEAGGSLENSFGYHALHHDYPGDRIRHTRRHLPVSAYNPTELKLNDDEWKNDFQSYLQRVNDKVKKLLCHEKLLSKHIKIATEKMLYAVSLYLNYNNTDIKNGNNIKLLAQKILSDSGMYGENKNEKLSSEQAKTVVHNWVFQNILGTTPEKYIASEMKLDITRSYIVADIHRLLSVGTLPVGSYFNPDNLSVFEQSFLSIMWNKLILEDMPFLEFSDEQIKTIPLNDFKFANLYSGASFIKNIKEENISPDDIIATGESMWDLSISEGIPVNKLAYYFAPAILWHATLPPEYIDIDKTNDFDIINNYLSYRIEVNTIKKNLTEKYNAYISARKSWLSREKLADDIVDNCPSLKPFGPTDLADTIRSPEQRREKAKYHAKQAYMNNWFKPCDSAPNDLNNEYRILTDTVANRFIEVDKYFIIAAINVLPMHDMKFIFSPKTKVSLAKLAMNSSSWGRFWNEGEIDVEVEKIDVFSFQQDKQERIYALQATKDEVGYRFIRLDRDLGLYISYDILRKYISKINIWGTPSVYNTDKNSFNKWFKLINTPLEMTDNNSESFIDAITKIHRINFSNGLYQSGNDKSDTEKVWNTAKHFIPFYDCIDSAVENRPAEASVACVTDILSLIPVVGQASSLGARFSAGLAKGLRSGTSSLGKAGIKAAGKNMLRELSLPTTAELASLGKNTIMALDPGFSVLKSFPSISRKYAEKVVTLISAKKSMTALVKNLETRIATLPQVTSNAQVTGILPGTALEVPVTAIGKQDGKNIYVRVNPETGEKFGDKFTCLNNGILATVSSILNRNKRSYENIYMRQSINIDENNTSRVRRAGNNPNLCSEQPSTSRASQTHTIMNPSSDMLLRLQGESTVEWARRLLQLDLSVMDTARRTGISRHNIAKWPEVDKIRQQKELEKVQSHKLAVQLMNEKTALDNQDLFAISKKTGIPVNTLSKMDEYKPKRLNPKHSSSSKNKEKALDMLQAGYTSKEVAAKTNYSQRTLNKQKKEWRDVASIGDITTAKDKEDSLLRELCELRKTHNTDSKTPPDVLIEMKRLLSSITDSLSFLTQKKTSISIGIDKNKKLHMSFSKNPASSKLDKWAIENNVNIIKSTGHAEESLINAIPDIIHIESSHNICLECEVLLLKNNIGTSGSFSHHLSKSRKAFSHYSSTEREYAQKLKTEFDAKKAQLDEAKRLMLEGKLSLVEIARVTDVPASTMSHTPEYKTWQKLRQQAKIQDPNIEKARELHRLGKSQRQIAIELNVQRGKVYQWIEQKTSNLKSERARQLYLQGKQQKDIAKELGASTSMVCLWLKPLTSSC